MTSILVVCTGNICRSPVAEGLIRDALRARFGDTAPRVSSAGTLGWGASGAMPESVQAAAELGTDISGHEGRRLVDHMIDEADLIVCMTAEHRMAVARLGAGARAKTFTLKELVLILEHLPAEALANDTRALPRRVAEADAARREGSARSSEHEDVEDPLGGPIESFREMAIELDDLTKRLVDGLFGVEPKERTSRAT